MSVNNDTASRLARVAPQIRPAGMSGDYTQATVQDLTSSYNPAGVVTPNSVKKFHHRGPEVGEPTRHWGLAADTPADGDARYGIKSKEDGNIDGCMRPSEYADRMTSLVGEQREKNYASARRQPLGRVPDPAHPVPTPLKGFGKAYVKGESTASTIGAMRDVDVLHQPGAQTDRGYNWQTAGIDPTQHRFGAPSEKSQSTASVLAGSAETTLVPTIVKDYRSTVDYEVGKPRSYGFDDPAEWDASKRPAVRARAKAANGFQAEQPTVKELLSTWAVEVEEAGDGSGSGSGHSGANAGKNNSGHGGGNGLRETMDTTMRRGNTVDTLVRLEDDVTVQQLVHPCHYVSLGVQSKYFAGGRTLEDVRALAAKCGFGLTDAQVDEVFAAHAVDGKCGIEQFKNVAMSKGYM